jgi:hypothetical protein
MDKKYTILYSLWLFLIILCSSRAADNLTPCTMKALIDLKEKAKYSLTNNELELLLELQESCFQYNTNLKTGISPCDDQLFKWLKEQKLENLSSNQIKYFAKINEVCNNYTSSESRKSAIKEKLPAIIVGGTLGTLSIIFLIIGLPIILIHNNM